MNTFRRCVASAVAALLLTSQLSAASAASSPRTAGRPTIAVNTRAPQRIAVPEPPRRTMPPRLVPSTIRSVPVDAVRRPANLRRPPGVLVAGPQMLTPKDINRLLSAALAKQRAVERAGAIPAAPAPNTAPSPTSPGRRHGGPVPGKGAPRTTHSLQGSYGTGINPWWRYQEELVPGGGHVMVNVGTGNMLLQDDDMSVPHKGIALAFRRTYNSQSGHDVSGTDGSLPSLYGNGWTTTFDAHLSGSRNGTMTVWDIDGARYDYTVAADGVTLVPPPGQHGYLVSDGAYGYFWVRKSGTVYYFWAPDAATNWSSAVYQAYGGYAGRTCMIFGRNRNTYLAFYYTWDNGNSSATGKINAISAQTESGLNASLAFADYSGHRLLQQITFPDSATNVSYGYDAQGNLNYVSRPANNSIGRRATREYGYQSVGSGTAMYWADSPRWDYSCWSGVCGSDGGFLMFLFSGSSAATSTLNTIGHGAVINFSIPDGSNSPVLQSAYPTYATWYLMDYYTTGVTTPTFRDTDGHMTNWVVDSFGRPTQTQQCTQSAGSQCTGTWLVSNETWDASNNGLSAVDPRGNETDYAFDIRGNAVAVAQAAPAPGAFRPTQLYSYDANDNVTAYCDPNAVHSLSADWTSPPAAPVPGQGGLCPTQSTRATRLAWTTTGMDLAGELTAVTTAGSAAAPNGYTRTYAYDTAPQGGTDYGLPTSVTGTAITQPLDPVTPTRTPQQSFWYDTHGNLVCYGTGSGKWLLTYDAGGLGRLITSADPDDSASGTGTCGKTGAQPNWNTTTYRTYYPDGTLATMQLASQAASGVSTSYAYDLDGDKTSETRHFGCISSCTAGVTQKYYDGADRLVEVQQPYDATDIQGYPWSTRYIYDLSQGGTTPYRGMGLTGHGNLVATQELLTGTVWAPTYGQIYGISTGTWTDVRATTSDALDRPLNSYEAAFGDQPRATNAYDGAGSLGLLASVTLATNEFKNITYDNLGRQTDLAYGGDGGVTPAIHQTFDADGQLTSRSTSVLGFETIAYDNAGIVTSISEPAGLGGGTISYSYYPDGARYTVGYSDPTQSYPNAVQFAYRTDGKRDLLKLPNGSSFTWTFTAGGRLQSATDPLTGTTVHPDAQYQKTPKLEGPYYPANVTYGAFTQTFDSYGRISTTTLPVSLFAYTAAVYDLEDGIARHTVGGYAPTPPMQKYPATQTICLQSSIRNSKTPLSIIYGGACAMGPGPPVEINGAQLVGTPPAGTNVPVAQNWTLDARSGSLLHQTGTRDTETVGSSYTYDASGRMIGDYEGASEHITTSPNSWPTYTSNWCPSLYVGAPPYQSGLSCYTNGTRTKTYDAENRLRTETFSYQPEWSANGPTYTTKSYGFAEYGAYWQDTSGYALPSQPANIQAVDYSASGHPMRFSLFHPDGIGSSANETRLWLWDGNERLLQCQFVNGACQSPVLSLEGLGTYDLAQAKVRVMDRGRSGQIAMIRDTVGFSGFSDIGESGKATRAIYAPCSIDSAPTGSVCDKQRDGKLSADGWSLEYESWQGVRSSDQATGQWNTPDAYAGVVNDPTSQKPFIWNRNNPYDYADPSGFDPCSASLGGCPGTTESPAWKLKVTARGKALEKEAGQNLPDWFPGIDRADPAPLGMWLSPMYPAMRVVSIKSLDTRLSSYQTFSGLYSKLKGYVDSLAGMSNAEWRSQGAVVLLDSSTLRQLTLVIPKTATLTAEQEAAINAIAAYAASNGIVFNVERR